MRFLFFIYFISQVAMAQFAPPQGQTGSNAMYKDSSAFVAWATSCKVTRGLQDISNIASGYTSVGDSSSAINNPDGNVVSLGDGGYAICTFKNEIYNGEGYDFAVFENSFDGNYLELAFVEVSSDGVNFFRFPATSDTQDTLQTGPFGYTEASKINNLAGKYITQYGTPFDLNEMRNINGLDINHITHIKIIDVVGSLNNTYATHDINGHKVNDPWPTPYASGGFDLDAIGIINQQIDNSVNSLKSNQIFKVYPNPAKDEINIISNQLDNLTTGSVEVIDMTGKCVLRQMTSSPMVSVNVNHNSGLSCKIDVSELNNGIYFIKIIDNDIYLTQKISITR